jgi:uncharacterized protein YjbI with pentapeptide repeats
MNPSDDERSASSPSLPSLGQEAAAASGAQGLAPGWNAPASAGSTLPPFRASGGWTLLRRSASLRLLLGVLLTLLGLLGGWPWLVLPAALLTLVMALQQLLPPLWRLLVQRLDDGPTAVVVAMGALILTLTAIPLALGWFDPVLKLYSSGNWDAIAAIGEGVVGAFGQILVALVALAIAWRQVMVDQRLTSQQNRITQAQTIDSFIQGISQLVSDEEGLLEDWPLERMLAEGRLAAVLSSIDADGKARILRFLSHARLLTPLRRDGRLGRAILDGKGSYQEDRFHGVPVIQLNRMLQGVDLAGADLRGVDFNRADLRGTILSGADLSEANLAGCDLGGANLEGARLEGALFFLGRAQTATPRAEGVPIDQQTGAGSGAIVENINLSGARQLDPQAHFYLASWSGKRSRRTLPGGCRSVPSRL